MKDPAVLFYTSDFLTGVSDLTMEERGQYITLLCLQHQKGRLSKKMITIAAASVTVDVLDKFTIDEEGNYFNARLELEAKKRAEHARKQSERAKKGWEKRKKEKQSLTNTTAHAAALPLESVNENDNVININKVPEFEIFKNYAIQNKPNVSIEHLKLKYEAWISSGWKVERRKEMHDIKNWKTTLLNTLPYLKEEKKVVGADLDGRYIKKDITDYSWE